MNKKIIALAVAAAFTAPMAAQAEIKTYGQAQVEYGMWGGDAAAGETVEDNARGRIGFKSSEDLGNGMKALAKFEFKVDTADGDAAQGQGGADTKNAVSLQKREMMIGLKGGFGEVQFGRLKTAYKYTGGVKYDPFTATILEARGNAGMSGKVGIGAIKNAAGHNGFVSDSLAYKVKSGNINFWITYDLDTGKATGNSGSAMTASVKYKAKNWEAFVALVDDDNDGLAGDSYSSTKFGGQYKVGAHKISVQIEGADANGTDVDYTYVDYQLKMGKNMLDVAIGNVESNGGEADFLRLAMKHKFSKKTSAWVGYRETDGGAGNAEDVVSLGMRVDF